MNLLRFGAIAVASVLMAGAAHADTFSLSDALATAYATNPQLDAERANLRATDENVAKANAGWRPSVNAQGSYSIEHYEITQGALHGTSNSHPLQGQVTVDQPILRGGQTYAGIRRAKALVRAGRAQLQDTEQTVLLNAVSAYMNVVRDTAIVNLRQSNVDVLQKQFNATDLQFNVGELTRTDVAQSQARLSGAQADLTAAQGQLAISRANFEQVIGRPAETLNDEPPLPQTPASEDDVLNLALRGNPQLIAAREAERAADFAVDGSVGALLPQLSVRGQYGWSRSNNFGIPGSNPVGSVKATAIIAQLTIPIYQGGADEANVRQAKQLHSQAQLNAVYAERQVREAVRSAWEAYQSARATIVSNEKQVKANKLAFEGVRKEQQVGARTILDVLNAQQEFLNSEVAVVSSRRNTVVAAYQLLAAAGELTAKDLGLKVTLYDPNAYYDDNAARWFGFN
ncbi:MAG TPA: TolC family outer membrane protein [Rhizomicrobium sp.]|jgi:outer membrane protein|nr:TolC family outer membrane protein [Rhizomicrobium sp.]